MLCTQYRIENNNKLHLHKVITAYVWKSNHCVSLTYTLVDACATWEGVRPALFDKVSSCGAPG